MLRYTGGWGPYGLPLARCPTRPGEGIDDSAVTPSHQAGPPFPSAPHTAHPIHDNQYHAQRAQYIEHPDFAVYLQYNGSGPLI